MPEWFIDVALGLACGRLGSFPGWKLMYRAQWNVAEREGHTLLRHLPGFSGVAWSSTVLGGGLAAWTGVPWWSLSCGLLVGCVSAGFVWAAHLISPQHADDKAGAAPDQ